MLYRFKLHILPLSIFFSLAFSPCPSIFFFSHFPSLCIIPPFFAKCNRCVHNQTHIDSTHMKAQEKKKREKREEKKKDRRKDERKGSERDECITMQSDCLAHNKALCVCVLSV